MRIRSRTLATRFSLLYVALVVSVLAVGEAAASGAQPDRSRPRPGSPLPRASIALPQGMTLNELEQQLIQQVLRETGGNVSRAARRLGIGREALRYRLRKTGATGTDD